MSNTSFAGGLSQWLTLHTLGRKPGAQKFNREISDIVSQNWPGYLNASRDTITSEQVMDFARRVTRYCPSRWNAILSALHFITPLSHVLKRRRLLRKERPILSEEQFARLLVELDKRPRSKAGAVVRLLAVTGMRIGEARMLRWSHIGTDYFYVPGEFTKNGKPKALPFINGTAAAVALLKALAVTDQVQVLPQQDCRRALRTACRLAGLPRLTHHDLRHLFTTRCIQCGVDIPTLARWLGHQDGGALLMRDYFHMIDEHSRRMAARVTIAA